MRFSQIGSARASGVGGKNTGPITTLFRQALADAHVTERPPLALRPSSFPLCSIHVMEQQYQHEMWGYVPSTANLFSDFFLSVGTTAHEVFQKWMARNGRMWGNWKCTNNECQAHGVLLTNCVAHECKKCGKPLLYVEIEVEYHGVCGHVDGIVEVQAGEYVILDYKTASSNKLSRKKLPSHENYKQLSSYAYILWKKYKLNVVGFSLLYVTRDNPAVFSEYYFDWSTEVQQTTLEFLRSQVKRYRAGIAAWKQSNVDLAIAAKPCASEADYRANQHVYSECAHLDVCFTKRLKQHLEQQIAEMKTSDDD